jgi:MOSC domain-containing protein YiiM
VLEERLQRFDTPRDVGRVVMIVRRGDHGLRECLDRVALTMESGIPGDSWGRRHGASLDAQLTVIQSDVAELIANGQPLALFGDNLYLDLDLSSANLPTGSRVRAGTVTLEVSPLPHNGCQKFNARFGNDALKFVSKRDLRPRNLRGIYMRVADAGELAVGDSVEVISR